MFGIRQFEKLGYTSSIYTLVSLMHIHFHDHTVHKLWKDCSSSFSDIVYKFSYFRITIDNNKWNVYISWPMSSFCLDESNKEDTVLWISGLFTIPASRVSDSCFGDSLTNWQSILCHLNYTSESQSRCGDCLRGRTLQTRIVFSQRHLWVPVCEIQYYTLRSSLTGSQIKHGITKIPLLYASFRYPIQTTWYRHRGTRGELCGNRTGKFLLVFVVFYLPQVIDKHSRPEYVKIFSHQFSFGLLYPRLIIFH